MTCALVIFGHVVASAAPTPQPAPTATPAPVATKDPGNTSKPCGGVPVVSQVCSTVQSVTDIPGDIVSSMLKSIDQWAANSAQWVLNEVVHLLDVGTKPVLTASWFKSNWQTMSILAAMVMLPLLLLACVKGALQGDASIALRAGFVYVPLALIGTAVALNLVQLLINITDDMSVWVGGGSAGFGANMQTFANGLGNALGGGTAGGNLVAPFVFFFASIITILVGLLLFLELLLREAAIYATALFLPLAFAGIVFPGAAGVAKKLFSTLMALILSKFFIVAILALGMSALTNDLTQNAAGTNQPGLVAVSAGITILVLAILVPAMLLSLLPLVETAAISTIGMRRAVAGMAPPTSAQVYSSVRRDNEARLGGLSGGFGRFGIGGGGAGGGVGGGLGGGGAARAAGGGAAAAGGAMAGGLVAARGGASFLRGKGMQLGAAVSGAPGGATSPGPLAGLREPTTDLMGGSPIGGGIVAGDAIPRATLPASPQLPITGGEP